MGAYTDKFLTYLLTPASWLYGLAVGIRNKLYDAGIYKEHSFKIPVISVGNLTVGGAGKTPHVEYLIENMLSKHNIAVLSRGYKRKTKGFVLANSHSTPEHLGDEPYQIYRKFGDRIKVAVCEDRKKGIEEIIRIFPEIDLVILDDAFQHRSVKPDISILLLDKNKPLSSNKLLPLGTLREHPHGKDRADIVIATKCARYMNQLEYSLIAKEMDLLSFQKLYFSSISYQDLKPVFEEEAVYGASLSAFTEQDSALVVTGIASPRHFIRFFKNYPFKISIMRFPDHHSFSEKDITNIVKHFHEMDGKHKLIITTEKDGVRLLNNPYFPHKLKPFVFYLPIKMHLHNVDETDDLIDRIEMELLQKRISH